MNWNYWIPWREVESKESNEAKRVIEGSGPKRVLINESENPDHGATD